MAKIFVALNNFCRKTNDYCAMPPFYQSFIEGLKNAGNYVECFQTRTAAGGSRFPGSIPKEYKEFLRMFDPDLCILFNNNFWDISDVVDCPIVIYDTDSPLEWQLKDNLIENVDRYLFVYNQIKGKETLEEYFNVKENSCCYIPFFSEVKADEKVNFKNNIVFLGTNWTWKGYDFLNNFIKSNPSKEDVKKAMEVLELYKSNPLKPSHELYYELQNCPHDRINLGNLFRCATEVSGLRRLKYLAAVADLGLEIHGSYWNIDMMNYFPELLACVRNEQIWTKEENEQFYNSSKIALNTNHIQATGGFSFRVCDIMASNACLVSEKSSDLEELFPKVEIPFFTSPVEAREQCKKLIENENMRKEIVQAAHEAIDKDFRFENVLKKLEEFVGLNLRSDNEGVLIIFPSTEAGRIQVPPFPAVSTFAKNVTTIKKPDVKNVSKVDSNSKKSKQTEISSIQKFYYKTLGKHLGYDPYGYWDTRYIYIGKTPIFKIITINANRKELYMGCFPIASYSLVNGRSVLKCLLIEKTGRALKKIFKTKKRKTELCIPKKEEKIVETQKPITDTINENVSKLSIADKKQLRMEQIKEKFLTGEKIKICLFVSRINCWMFTGLYDILQQSGKFEPIIVIKPFMSRGFEHMKECMNSTYEGMLARGYAPIKGYDEDTDTFLNVKEEIDPDIVFYTKYWKPHFQENFYINKFRDCITLLIDYGYNVAGHYEAMNFELQNAVDMYFYYSQIQKEIVSKHMNNKGRNVVITGAPKIDTLFNSNYTAKDVWKKQKKTKKRIIWAPHHEDKTGPKQYQFDAFYDLYEVMFEIAEKYKDEIQIAFKPHPLLKVKLYDKWGEVATENYYNRWNELSNGQLEEGDFIDLFLTSDAMILDCLSFIAEYTATNKPALFTVGSRSRVLLNDMGKQIYEMLYHAKDNLKDEICTFVEEVVIAGNDPMNEQRKVFVEENIVPPNNKFASENVYDAICEYILDGGIEK